VAPCLRRRQSRHPDHPAHDPTDIGGTLYFGVPDDQYGDEVWTSDGTEAGTVLVKDINPGRASSNYYFVESSPLTNDGDTF
jgi:ELWxxDGT repeat protein